MGGAMARMTPSEMAGVSGGGFWSGVGCGLGLVASFYALVSPDPFSKIALVSYGGTAISCVTAFDGTMEVAQ